MLPAPYSRRGKGIEWLAQNHINFIAFFFTDESKKKCQVQNSEVRVTILSSTLTHGIRLLGLLEQYLRLWLTQQNFIFLQLWSLEVGDQGTRVDSIFSSCIAVGHISMCAPSAFLLKAHRMRTSSRAFSSLYKGTGSWIQVLLYGNFYSP